MAALVEGRVVCAHYLIFSFYLAASNVRMLNQMGQQAALDRICETQDQ